MQSVRSPHPAVIGNTAQASLKRKGANREEVSKTVTRIAYKVYEVAPMLGVDPKTVYDLVNSGRLRYTRLTGGTILIPASALEDYLNGDAVA